MAEWSIAAVLKTVRPRGLRGSNPLPSSSFLLSDPDGCASTGRIRDTSADCARIDRRF